MLISFFSSFQLCMDIFSGMSSLQPTCRAGRTSGRPRGQPSPRRRSTWLTCLPQSTGGTRVSSPVLEIRSRFSGMMPTCKDIFVLTSIHPSFCLYIHLKTVCSSSAGLSLFQPKHAHICIYLKKIIFLFRVSADLAGPLPPPPRSPPMPRSMTCPTTSWSFLLSILPGLVDNSW